MPGHTISLYLKERGYEVLGFDRLKSQLIESVVGDARDIATLEKLSRMASSTR